MCRRIAGSLVKQCHIELAAHAPVNFVHATSERLRGGQQLQGLGINLLALGGQRKTGPAAATQRQTQPGLQILHMAADGGGTDVQLQFSRRHTTAVHHGLEHPQQAQIHIAQLAQDSMAFGLNRSGRAYFHKNATE